MIVPPTCFHRFTRWEVFQFMYDMLALVEARIDELPEALVNKVEEMRNAFDIFDEELVQVRRPSIEKLSEAEVKRDYAVRKIYQIIQTYSSYNFSEEKEIAAKGLLFVFEPYGTGRYISRQSQDSQTAILTILLQELARPQSIAHIATLHLTDAVAALTANNQFFIEEQHARKKAEARYVTEVARNARIKVQNEFYEFVDLMNALAIVEGEEKYVEIKKILNHLLKEYISQARQRHKKKMEPNEPLTP